MFGTRCAHSLTNIGTTIRLVAAWRAWSLANERVHMWTEQGLQCQRSKVRRHVPPPIGPFTAPNARFDHPHINVGGLLAPRVDLLIYWRFNSNLTIINLTRDPMLTLLGFLTILSCHTPVSITATTCHFYGFKWDYRLLLRPASDRSWYILAWWCCLMLRSPIYLRCSWLGVFLTLNIRAAFLCVRILHFWMRVVWLYCTVFTF